MLGWSQDELAQRAGVAKQTLADFERGARSPYSRTLADIREALETAGVVFIDEDGGGAGVRLRKVVARLLKRHFASDLLIFHVEYAGQVIKCQFRREVLTEWDDTRYRETKEFEQAFDRHADMILVRAQDAIEAERVEDGTLLLTLADFPGVR